MKEFKDRVAVVTGAASGIGRGLAERFAAEGMHVVLADLNPTVETVAAQISQSTAAQTLAVTCDVSRREDVEALHEATLHRFGAAHILCNNAGIGPPGRIEATSLAMWDAVIGASLYGTIYGIHYFLPTLQKQPEAHIVNTASLGGLLPSMYIAPYAAAKAGQIMISETLFREERIRGGNVGVTVLCPGHVRTNIGDFGAAADRVGAPLDDAAELVAFRRDLATFPDTALEPPQVADMVMAAIVDQQLYVVTDPNLMPLVKIRFDDIMALRNPSF
jgi:NAD(P)-dependent dehydrogenase (short-subunit alcohol dehydrogenase family)